MENSIGDESENLEIPYDPAILFLGICPKNLKTLIWKDMCNPMFIVILLKRAKI